MYTVGVDLLRMCVDMLDVRGCDVGSMNTKEPLVDIDDRSDLTFCAA